MEATPWKVAARCMVDKTNETQGKQLGAECMSCQSLWPLCISLLSWQDMFVGCGHFTPAHGHKAAIEWDTKVQEYRKECIEACPTWPQVVWMLGQKIWPSNLIPNHEKMSSIYKFCVAIPIDHLTQRTCLMINYMKTLGAKKALIVFICSSKRYL